MAYIAALVAMAWCISIKVVPNLRAIYDLPRVSAQVPNLRLAFLAITRALLSLCGSIMAWIMMMMIEGAKTGPLLGHVVMITIASAAAALGCVTVKAFAEAALYLRRRFRWRLNDADL
jgi:hypothetical protein